MYVYVSKAEQATIQHKANRFARFWKQLYLNTRNCHAMSIHKSANKSHSTEFNTVDKTKQFLCVRCKVGNFFYLFV